jgi:hypothetical protein
MHYLSAVAAAFLASARCRGVPPICRSVDRGARNGVWPAKIARHRPAAACHLWPLRSAVCSTTLAIDLQWQVHARRLNVTHAYISALLAQTRLLSDNL